MRKLLLTTIIFFTAALSPLLASAQADSVSLFESNYVQGEVIRKTPSLSVDVYDYETRLSDGSIISFETVENHIKVGSKVYLEHYVEADEFVFIAINRSSTLLVLLFFFVFLILALTKKKGLRALLSLSLSFLLLIFGLVPLLLKGYDPIWLALVFGSLILFLSIFVTHGFTRQSLISFVGSSISIVVATLLVLWVTGAGSFSGITDHSALFLSQYGDQSIQFIRLYAAAVIIGTLGVLDDITITQVSVVRELADSSQEGRRSIFLRALSVGQDHISSLVNTLMFAYVGSALPLIMFTTQVDTPFSILVSQEFIAAEIVRALVGAIALIIAVPVTTWFATYPFFHFIRKDEHAVGGHNHPH